jgi:hypothetical protein
LPLNRYTPKLVLPLIAGTALFAASTTIIGMASSQNSSTLTLDNSRVSGNATLFDGSTVEASGYSRLALKNGTRMDLGAGSRVKVFANHASLDRGMSEIQSGSGFEIDANTLKIRTAGKDAIARVKLDNKTVMVTALNAPVEVINPAGLLIAKVAPGLPMSFIPQAGSSSASDMTGCVVNKGGKPVLVTDSNQSYQLVGASNPKSLIGNKVHVVGTMDSSTTPPAGVTGAVKATSATVTSKGGCASAASAIGATTATAGLAAGAAAGAAGAAAGGAAAGAAAAGIGISTTALVVGGVAAATAASIGGAAAAGAFNTSP